MDLSQIYETLETDQEAIESELEQTGELNLEPGKSYSLNLQSFCIEPGVSPPMPGDELNLVPTDGPAKNWIYEILQKQGTLNIPQEKVQYVIWALLSDIRFDELDDEEQRILLQFYPNARIKFGNRKLENIGRNFFDSFLPSPVHETFESFQDYKDEILYYRHDFKKLARALLPESHRKASLPVGWLKMNEGYFIKLTAQGYTETQIDIFVPENLSQAQGQKLALSSKSSRKKKKLPDECSKLKTQKSSHCQELTSEDRQKILTLADPKNFTKTRYQMHPRKGKSIEEETDCSHFANEIYRRAGFDFPYASTGNLTCVNTFQEIPNDQAQPGDLLLYKGHVGIMDKDGGLISATVGSDRFSGIRIERAKLSIDDKDFKSSISRIPKSKNAFSHSGFGTPKVIRWGCP
jgi:hypothetical protein